MIAALVERNGQEEQSVTKLNLDDITDGDLPRLEVRVKNSKDDVIAHIEASLVALIVSPLNRVLYLEAACTSDSTAHALMGAVTDPRGAVEFRFYQPGERETYTEIHPPEAARVANSRLSVPAWSRFLHHVALFERTGELLIAQDDQTLWRKLREHMTCPTLESWERELMPKINKSGLLLPCEAFGIPVGYNAFVLSVDAADRFDEIISAYVRKSGLLVA